MFVQPFSKSPKLLKFHILAQKSHKNFRSNHNAISSGFMILTYHTEHTAPLSIFSSVTITSSYHNNLASCL